MHEEKHDIYITCGFEWGFQGEHMSITSNLRPALLEVSLIATNFEVPSKRAKWSLENGWYGGKWRLPPYHIFELVENFKTTQEKRHKYHPKKASPLPRFILKYGSNSSLESYLKVFSVTHAPLQPWPFLSKGFVVSCETVWVAIDFAWENGVTCSTPFFFVQSSNEQRKLRLILA